jgi:integrase/recombinase XerD
MVMPYGSGQKTKGRTVFLGKVSRRSVWHYLAIREDPRPDEPLFITQDYHPFQRQVLRELLIRIGERAGVQNAHPHKFRHTFATEYLRNGGDIYTLQRQLGHSSLKMVLRYLDIVKGDISEAHRRASPADRWRL